MQSDSASPAGGDSPADGREVLADPVRRLLDDPHRGLKLQFRHWGGIFSLAIAVIGAAILLPPLVADEPVSGGTVPSWGPASVTSDAPFSPSPSGSPASSPSARPSGGGFTPVTVEAEDATLSKGADIVTCTTCSGGQRVAYLGQVDVHVTVPKAGTRTITVVYEADHESVIEMKVRGHRLAYEKVTGDDLTEQRTVRFSVRLPAGDVTLGFYAYEGDPAELDLITVR
ncbi:hypothetical protein [Actinoplanes sp. NPDC051851]|uniref:hypothetical protein n=1 Tax=Actinoplanes sp. NPDC051851 TaxID=3154753 RepID=UPI00341BB46B